MNKVILLGRVGGDPEVKQIAETKVCKFSLATSKKYKKNGEKVETTTWHNLVFFGLQCDTLKSYVHKGDQLMVEGEIQTRQYKDKNGVDHWATEIVCDRFELLSKPKEAKEAPQAQDKWQGGKKEVSDINELPQHVKDAESASDNMNDLPF